MNRRGIQHPARLLLPAFRDLDEEQRHLASKHQGRSAGLAVVLALSASSAWAGPFEVYGIKSLATADGSEAPAHLIGFDSTGGVHDFGAISLVSGGLVDVDALAWGGSLATSRLFAFAQEDSTAGVESALISFDLDTSLASAASTSASATRIGDFIDDRDIRGAAFDPTGTLWAIDAFQNQVLTVDTATGALTSVATLNGAIADLSNASDIVFRSDGSAVLTSQDGSGLWAFFDLDPFSGFTSLIEADTNVPTQAFAGLAARTDMSGGAFAYDVNGSDDIYSLGGDFDPAGRTLVYAGIPPGFNSGRGDLASLGFLQPTAVPAPGAFALIGLGLIGLGARRRRRTA